MTAPLSLVLAGLSLAIQVADDPRAPEPAPRKVVILAGDPDAGHPPGTHEYEKSARLLKHCLETAANFRGVRAEVYPHGWPRDEAVLDTADAIVLIASGSDRREQDHPFLVGERLQVIGKQMKRGCGLVVLHWCTFFPNANAGERALDWVGGHFDYQSGPPPRRWASAIQHVTAALEPSTPGHPALSGVPPFSIRDEFYYQIRFRPDDPRLKPIIKAAIPGVAEKQTVAWAVERSDGGRGFGFTGGHYFDNWWNPHFRKPVLNAIAWTAHAEVPKDGIDAEPPAKASFDVGPAKP
jgi:type 1 glutamine amidotransferase